MHGIIFNQLFKFVRETHGFDTLNVIMDDAGLKSKFYDVTESHPDIEIGAIIEAACKRLEVDRETILESFGFFLVPSLIKTYYSLLLPSWRTIELLSNIETTMHKSVRLTQKDASPPQLDVERINNKEVNIKYFSKRKMHSLGIGLIKGIAHHYNEENKLKITVSDLQEGKLINVRVN